MKPIDIRKLLEDWPYRPGANIRRVQLPDGRTVIQVRLPFGIEQYEQDGRPDGLRPHGCESLLRYHLQRLGRLQDEGKESAFRLSPKECAALFEEGTMYYHRYVHFFELEDWTRAFRDTRRNICLFDFVNRYASRKEDRMHLEQWRPYLLRMNGVAEAMMALRRGEHDRAAEAIRHTIAEIEALPKLDQETFQYEYDRSIAALRELADQIRTARPPSPIEALERELQAAVTREEFERAAELRDRIRALRERPTS